ncbi:Uncharacterised protein [Nocardia africana]|uniref:Uncharacterized protein n=1 Tax=Nocardia africana TaxID=134964 RepID=A0A378WTD5_9NOCA|nr:Uncharacterised protein [Nocardia africana]
MAPSDAGDNWFLSQVDEPNKTQCRSVKRSPPVGTAYVTGTRAAPERHGAPPPQTARPDADVW